jgi:hypothetical protein
MARAPARLAPSIKVWLRGFGAGCVTANLLVFARQRLKKPKAIIPLNDGLKFCSLARPPSSAGVSPYNYKANSYDDTHGAHGRFCRSPAAVRDGEVEHINRHRE